MVFIVRGKMESTGEDGNVVTLSEGDVCGEELLTWCLEPSSLNGDARTRGKPGYKLVCKRTVKCLSNVEAFVLCAADLEEVTTLFCWIFEESPRSNGNKVPAVNNFCSGYELNVITRLTMFRHESLYWWGLAATTIRVAWRYRKKWLHRGTTLPYKYK
ncbi:putative rmlC-like jelly roll, cyclic nucleotide-binding protein [Helianthus annuus]|nr:putative rmlC-like jelly roll, cyclic nucleotide-binding protein [Helianthus annuus]